jgi:hypothetical protein
MRLAIKTLAKAIYPIVFGLFALQQFAMPSWGILLDCAELQIRSGFRLGRGAGIGSDRSARSWV